MGLQTPRTRRHKKAQAAAAPTEAQYKGATALQVYGHQTHPLDPASHLLTPDCPLPPTAAHCRLSLAAYYLPSATYLLLPDLLPTTCLLLLTHSMRNTTVIQYARIPRRRKYVRLVLGGRPTSCVMSERTASTTVCACDAPLL